MENTEQTQNIENQKFVEFNKSNGDKYILLTTYQDKWFPELPENYPTLMKMNIDTVLGREE